MCGEGWRCVHPSAQPLNKGGGKEGHVVTWHTNTMQKCSSLDGDKRDIVKHRPRVSSGRHTVKTLQFGVATTNGRDQGYVDGGGSKGEGSSNALLQSEPLLCPRMWGTVVSQTTEGFDSGHLSRHLTGPPPEDPGERYSSSHVDLQTMTSYQSHKTGSRPAQDPNQGTPRVGMPVTKTSAETAPLPADFPG